MTKNKQTNTTITPIDMPFGQNYLFHYGTMVKSSWGFKCEIKDMCKILDRIPAEEQIRDVIECIYCNSEHGNMYTIFVRFPVDYTTISLDRIKDYCKVVGEYMFNLIKQFNRVKPRVKVIDSVTNAVFII